jgi:2-C-methyl-D-erythritol 4-phosphate cytidylyltransferase
MNTGIILAAGNSTRFNHKAPKQLHKINGKTILSHSVNALKELDQIIILSKPAFWAKKPFDIIVDTFSNQSTFGTPITHILARYINSIMHSVA